MTFAIKSIKYNVILFVCLFVSRLFYFSLVAAEITALCCFTKDVSNDQKIFDHYRQDIKFDFTWSYGTAWVATGFTILCFGSSILSIFNRLPETKLIVTEERKI